MDLFSLALMTCVEPLEQSGLFTMTRMYNNATNYQHCQGKNMSVSIRQLLHKDQCIIIILLTMNIGRKKHVSFHQTAATQRPMYNNPTDYQH